MTFQVTTQPRASRAYHHIVKYIAEQSEPGAIAWAKAYHEALLRLERAADTFSLASEDEDVDFELREVLFKTRRGGVYRALFTIHGNEVMILDVRGPGQDSPSSDEFDPLPGT